MTILDLVAARATINGQPLEPGTVYRVLVNADLQARAVTHDRLLAAWTLTARPSQPAPGRRQPYVATTVEGDELTFTKAGCGCGHPVKLMSPAQGWAL